MLWFFRKFYGFFTKFTNFLKCFDFLRNFIIFYEIYAFVQIQQGTETLRREAPALFESMGLPNMPGAPTSNSGSSNNMMQQMLQQMRYVFYFFENSIFPPKLGLRQNAVYQFFSVWDFLTGSGLLYKIWAPKWFFQTTSFISF